MRVSLKEMLRVKGSDAHLWAGQPMPYVINRHLSSRGGYMPDHRLKIGMNVITPEFPDFGQWTRLSGSPM